MSEIDLHTHSTASDGTMSPADLVRHAHTQGLRAISVTDHDTVEGIEDALAEGRRLGIEVIPGLEVSVDFARGTMHILGYYVDHRDPRLTAQLGRLQHHRRARNSAMIDRFNKLGILITARELEDISEDGQIGRPHFARLLVQRGYAGTIQEAFDRFLRKGAPAYVKKFKFSPVEVLGFLTECGGLSVLAHPFTLFDLTDDELENTVKTLKSEGLDGIEVYYPDHTLEQTTRYRKLAGDHELVVTGGSDFHGINKEGPVLGQDFGGVSLTYTLIDALNARRRARFGVGRSVSDGA